MKQTKTVLNPDLKTSSEVLTKSTHATQPKSRHPSKANSSTASTFWPSPGVTDAFNTNMATSM